MFNWATGTRQELPPSLFEDMGRYRREVFVNRLGWQLNVVNGMELDEFDSPQAVYVCMQAEDGQVNGVARLLPTTVPYLMQKVFPQLWAGPELPQTSTIWELSRFAAVDFSATHAQQHQATAAHAARLLRLAMQAARSHGAEKLITVSPIGMERLARVSGFASSRTGVPTRADGDMIVGLMFGDK